MLIVVQYQDEKFDMVIHYRLVELLKKGKVKGYSSSQGWVKIDLPQKEQHKEILNLNH